MVNLSDLPVGLRSLSAFYSMCKDHIVNHPTHVVLETFLCVFIFIVLFMKREYNPKKQCVGNRKAKVPPPPPPTKP